MNTLIILLIIFSMPLALFAIIAKISGGVFPKLIARTSGIGSLTLIIVILLKLTHVI